jgi:hypothetical protein
MTDGEIKSLRELLGKFPKDGRERDDLYSAIPRLLKEIEALKEDKIRLEAEMFGWNEVQRERDAALAKVKSLQSWKDSLSAACCKVLRMEGTATDGILESLSLIMAERDAALARVRELEAKYELIWNGCEVVYFFPEGGAYPIEHNPYTNKYGRFNIESALASSVLSTSNMTDDPVCECGHPKSVHGNIFGCWRHVGSGTTCNCLRFTPQTERMKK